MRKLTHTTYAKECRKRLGAATEASMDMNIAFRNFLK